MSEQKSITEQLLDMWEQDSVIPSTEPDKALLAVPKLHAKYLRYLSNYRLKSQALTQELALLRKWKNDWMSGRMTKEELEQRNLTQFPFVLKTEIKDHVDSDADVSALIRKKAVADEMVAISEAIIKELNARTWQLRSYIEFTKFIGGQ